MNKQILTDYCNMPKVFINGKEFVDIEIMQELLTKEIREDMKDADSQAEIDGMQQAIRKINSMR